jgi:hypothetical protein
MQAKADHPSRSSILKASLPGLSPHKLAAASVLVSLIGLFSACKETSAPVDVPPKPILRAASPTSISGTVASYVETLPAVFVHDANGQPLENIRVIFRLTSGGGSISGEETRSNAQGIATLAEWKLGTAAGDESVTATAGLVSVPFFATAVAGPPVSVAKISGDNQTAPRGTAIPIPLEVKVTDAYENPVASTVVIFTVEAGGGSLTGDNVTTNLQGVATLGSWTLGATGDQSVVTTVADLSPLTFRAHAIEPPVPCAAKDLKASTPVNATLTEEACRGGDGRGYDAYSVTLAGGSDWRFKVTSNAFNTRLEIRDEKGIPIASNREDTSTNNSVIRAILPEGRVTLVVTSVDPSATGSYEVSYTQERDGVAGCEVSVARGIDTNQNVTAGECTPKDAAPVDRYRIYLSAGSSLSLSLQDYSLSDNRFELQDDRGNTLVVGAVLNYVDSKLAFTAAVAGYYVISVQVYEAYLLSVR